MLSCPSAASAPCNTLRNRESSRSSVGLVNAGLPAVLRSEASTRVRACRGAARRVRTIAARPNQRSLTAMPGDPELYELSARVGHKLRAAERRLVTAESCTGGWVAKALTDVPGSSGWFECGYVTYSNTAKVRDLGVAATTLEGFGAVSEQTVREMAEGALRVSQASVALAVSGIAGPDGGTPDKPVGTVWFCAAARKADTTDIIAEHKRFDGDRDAIRAAAVQHALRMILRLDMPVRPEVTAHVGTR